MWLALARRSLEPALPVVLSAGLALGASVTACAIPYPHGKLPTFGSTPVGLVDESEPLTFACVGGRPYEHRITLQNQGPADRFEVLVRDGDGYVKSPLRQEISLAPAQSHLLVVTVQVPPSAPTPAPMMLDYHSVHLTVRSLTQPARETGIRLSATIPGLDEHGTLDERCMPSRGKASD